MSEIAHYLAEHRFQELFIDVLGWDRASGSCDVAVDGRSFHFDMIAHKRGFQIFHCIADGLTLKHRGRLRVLHKTISEQAHENVVIYTHDTPLRQVWQWAVRLEDGRRRRHREHPFFSASPPEALIERLAGLRFTLNEEEQVRLVDALERVRKVLDTTPDLNLFVKRPRYAEKGDQLAREMINGGQLEFERFIEFHRPLAAWAVKPLRGLYRMDIEDLEQIGVQGLIHAARRFDPDRGLQFATYATYCIQGYCKRMAPAAKHLIRIPLHVYWPCIKVRGKLHRLAGLGKNAADQYLERLRERDPDLSQQWNLFQRVADWKSLSDRKEPEFRQARLLVDPHSNPPNHAIRSELVATVRRCIDRLHERSSRVIRLRYGIDEQPLTLEQVARILGVTRERVRQIQDRAEDRLKRLIRLDMPSISDTPRDGEDTAAADEEATEAPISTQPECVTS